MATEHVFECTAHGIKLTVTIGEDGYESRRLEKEASRDTAGCVLADNIQVDSLKAMAAAGQTGRRALVGQPPNQTAVAERILYLGGGV